MPTDIEYRESLGQPFRSYRKVTFYGTDKQRRIEQSGREVGAFEESLTSIVEQIKAGQFCGILKR